MSETARRIRILRELHAAGSLTAEEEISRLYSGASVLEARFHRLLATGQLGLGRTGFVRAGRSGRLPRPTVAAGAGSGRAMEARQGWGEGPGGPLRGLGGSDGEVLKAISLAFRGRPS